MNDDPKRTHLNLFPHYLEIKTFAMCRDCLVPMLGILSYDAREYCIDHKHLHDKTEAPLKLA